MNKLDLIEKLQEEAGLTKTKTKAFVERFFDEMAEALADGGRVEMRGFCSFHVKEYDGYTGRNPKTGDRIKVAPKKAPFFKAGRELKKRVDK
ncbi:MAG: integration host factor subunit beta [Desulfobacteraceae bacterium]|jgi:integration host factor subunit beta|nr:integration host factor subunit beta [Desulfobacteraceae bacterium]